METFEKHEASAVDAVAVAEAVQESERMQVQQDMVRRAQQESEDELLRRAMQESMADSDAQYQAAIAESMSSQGAHSEDAMLALAMQASAAEAPGDLEDEELQRVLELSARDM